MKKILLSLSALLVASDILSSVICGITKDQNMDHGHGDFKKLKISKKSHLS